MALSPSSDPPDLEQVVPFGRVVELLAPALGREKSAQLVTLAARDRGMDPDRLSLDRTLEILMTLGSIAGVVGVAARFARTRLLSRRRKAPSGPHSRFEATTMPPESPSTSRMGIASVKIDSEELVALLAQTIGMDKGRQIVGAALVELGIAGNLVERHQALAVLDILAKAQGIVGIASRFAKARLILRFEQPRPE